VVAAFCLIGPAGPCREALAQKSGPDAPAQFVITSKVLRPQAKVPPLGANTWGRCGAIEWAANNFVHNSGNEPIHWRNLHRVKECGPNWFEIDGPGTSWWQLWGNGLLSGASLRIYRLVDRDGKSLPLNPEGNYLDLAKADHVEFVGKSQVIPEGTEGFPDGGWIANPYASPYPNAWIRHGNLSCTDCSGVENGRTYWYAIVAVGPDNQESEISNEVSVTPKAGIDTPPHVLVASDGDNLPAIKPGQGFEFTPKVFGGKSPYRWEVVDEQGKPLSLPDGLGLDQATGKIMGIPKADARDLKLVLKVADAAGRSDSRRYLINPKPPAKDGKEKPQPPTDVAAVAGDGCVTVTWKPSPSPAVIAYRLRRSDAPAAKQAQRVYVSPGGPALEKFDYVVIERKFEPFSMRWVNPRVRGIGNPMDSPAWYWNGDLAKLSFSLVPHPKPVPDDMLDPGETCLQIKAQPGEQSISQYVFIGTQMGGESIWYSQLEPGKSYRLEVWLRQEGLADDGNVTFSFGRGYPEIHKTFKVSGEWKKYTHEFTGPERPEKQWHFGHQFTFTGPGTLWMDNCRVFRCDRPEDAEKPYVPNPVVLKGLLAAQPAAGPKGAHRIWFLTRDATMKSIVSWHAGSRVNIDWRTSVEGTMDMTLPMGLTFDLDTGADPQSRMRPWLVMQHLLHSEEDWLGLVEYLAAPYDPQGDTPRSKPWAYQRFRQRGNGTPWTDEFAEIILEFGNETWHNGVFPDWLGFRLYHHVHQGGPEYGLFARYLIETMKKSPYWKIRKLDEKIRFCLGANYDGRVDRDRHVGGYGEEAVQTCPWATVLGHANYVGPKWETGDYSARNYDDHGVQETLLSFLRGPEPGQVRMMQARDALAKTHHEYDIAAYEGGPGGYALPGSAPQEQVEVNERYGKSLAMAVGSLDAWMRSYQYGWTYQCFLGYGQGNHWNSHTNFAEGFRPCPSWLALGMRNRYAAGDLMAVEERSVPTLTRGKDSYPLAGAYAMRQGDRWSVFVVSRKLDGNHDGHDFGDGFTRVALRLPFSSAEAITLYKMTGDPRLTNREKLNIRIRSQDIPADALRRGIFTINDQTGGSSGGLPPGSIYLYVFQETRSH